MYVENNIMFLFKYCGGSLTLVKEAITTETASMHDVLFLDFVGANAREDVGGSRAEL